MAFNQDAALANYRDLWDELNAVSALIAELEDRKREIRDKQRQLANGLVRARLDVIEAVTQPALDDQNLAEHTAGQDRTGGVTGS